MTDRPTMTDPVLKLVECLEAIKRGDVPRLIARSWRSDRPSPKYDECIHGPDIYEHCSECIDAFIDTALAAYKAAPGGWLPIEECPMWFAGAVTDGENIALAQKAEEAEFGGYYWSIDPEDALEWEPTHFIALPTPPAITNTGDAS